MIQVKSLEGGYKKKILNQICLFRQYLYFIIINHEIYFFPSLYSYGFPERLPLSTTPKVVRRIFTISNRLRILNLTYVDRLLIIIYVRCVKKMSNTCFVDDLLFQDFTDR